MDGLQPTQLQLPAASKKEKTFQNIIQVLSTQNTSTVFGGDLKKSIFHQGIPFSHFSLSLCGQTGATILMEKHYLQLNIKGPLPYKCNASIQEVAV